MLLKTMESRNLQEEKEIVCQTGETVGEESIKKFSANQLRTELNLTVCKYIVINYLNASKILKYEKRLKVPVL